MRRQVSARSFEDRKRLFDTVQQIAMKNLPLIPLVTPHILAAARRNLGNWRVAVMDHYVLWNVEQLYWQADTSRPNGGR
jgi:ABC-type transport system substrate-binding protein